MPTTHQPESPNLYLRELAASALADVDALGLEGDDRSVVLKFILGARREKPEGSPRVGGSGEHYRPPGSAGKPGLAGQPVDTIDKLAAALRVERDVLELVYDIRDDEPHLVISGKKLPEGKANGTRVIAQLIAAARQAVGLEEWTSSAVVRPVVQDYGRLDGNNFAANIQQLDRDNSALLRGKGAQREIKITRPGLEATGDLIREIAAL